MSIIKMTLAFRGERVEQIELAYFTKRNPT